MPTLFKKLFAFFLFHILMLGTSVGQGNEVLNDVFKNLQTDQNLQTEADWSEWFNINPPEKSKMADTCPIQKIVYGWNPYWMGTAYKNYQYNRLTDVAYFSYEVNEVTGGYESIHYWKTTDLHQYAHDAGTRVSLTITLFDKHKVFLENPNAWQVLGDSLTNLLNAKGAKGINIDFESIPSSLKVEFTAFVKFISNHIHTHVEGSIVTIALPAVDWGNVFDVSELLTHIDYFIIMAYEYYWKSSPTAGPVAPRNAGNFWSSLNVASSIQNYLKKGLPPSQMVVGLPYYGYDWPVENYALPATAENNAKSVLYKDAVDRANLNGRIWNDDALVPFYNYLEEATQRQCWYDDEVSLGFKYDLVNMYGLAGIGIWALGYDDGKEELWNLLGDKFSHCPNHQQGTLVDDGGPEGKYFTKTTSKQTVTIPDADSIRLAIQYYEPYDSQDTLWITNGVDNIRFNHSVKDSVVFLNGNSVQLSFSASVPAKGWLIHWDGIKKEKDLTLSKNKIPENVPERTFIGKISAPKESILSIENGYGLFEGDQFFVEGENLYAKNSFNFEDIAILPVLIQAKTTSATLQQLFLIEVTDENDAPSIYPMNDAYRKTGEPFVIRFPNPLFVDEDTGDSLSFSIQQSDDTPLPDWLNFNKEANGLVGFTNKTDTLQICVNVSDQKITTSMCFKLYMGLVTGIQQPLLSGFKAYPNPFEDYIYISHEYSHPTHFRLYNLMGTTVFERIIPSGSYYRIALMGNPPGMYFLRNMETGEVIRVVKK